MKIQTFDEATMNKSTTLRCDACAAEFGPDDDGSLIGSLVGRGIETHPNFCPACTKIMLLSLEGRKSAAPANPG